MRLLANDLRTAIGGMQYFFLRKALIRAPPYASELAAGKRGVPYVYVSSDDAHQLQVRRYLLSVSLAYPNLRC